MKPYDPNKHADPLLEHAEHRITQTGRACSDDLQKEFGIDFPRAFDLIVTLDWRGGQAGGVAA